MRVKKTKAVLLTWLCVWAVGSASAMSVHVHALPHPSTQANNEAAHFRYRINLALDFAQRSYTGVERVRWINRDNRPASLIYLYVPHTGVA